MSSYARAFEIPQDFPPILREFAKEAIREQPPDIYEWVESTTPQQCERGGWWNEGSVGVRIETCISLRTTIWRFRVWRNVVVVYRFGRDYFENLHSLRLTATGKDYSEEDLQPQVNIGTANQQKDELVSQTSLLLAPFENHAPAEPSRAEPLSFCLSSK